MNLIDRDALNNFSIMLIVLLIDLTGLYYIVTRKGI